jgi:hypothetical protein
MAEIFFVFLILSFPSFQWMNMRLAQHIWLTTVRHPFGYFVGMDVSEREMPP